MLRLIANGIQEQATTLVVGQGLSLAQDDTGLPVLQAGGRVVTRVLPTAASGYVEVGTWTLPHGAHNLDVSVSVDAAGFVVAKRYVLVGNAVTPATTYEVTPAVESGEFAGNDVALEAHCDGPALTLRLRRHAGTTAGTAVVMLRNLGPDAATFVESAGTGTSSDTLPTYPHAVGGGGGSGGELFPTADRTGAIGLPDRRWKHGYFHTSLSVGEPDTSSRLNVRLPADTPDALLATFGIAGKTLGFYVNYTAASADFTYNFRRGPILSNLLNPAAPAFATVALAADGAGADASTENYARFSITGNGDLLWGSGSDPDPAIQLSTAPTGTARLGGSAAAGKNLTSRLVLAKRWNSASPLDAWANTNLGLHNDDGRPVGIGFRREGYSATALVHDGEGFTIPDGTGEVDFATQLKVYHSDGTAQAVLTSANMRQYLLTLRNPAPLRGQLSAPYFRPAALGARVGQAAYNGNSDVSSGTVGTALHYVWGYQRAGEWAYPYPDLVLGYHTGLAVGANWTYGGTRFYDEHPDVDTPTLLFAVGHHEQRARAYGGFTVQGDHLPESTTSPALHVEFDQSPSRVFIGTGHPIPVRLGAGGVAVVEIAGDGSALLPADATRNLGESARRWNTVWMNTLDVGADLYAPRFRFPDSGPAFEHAGGGRVVLNSMSGQPMSYGGLTVGALSATGLTAERTSDQAVAPYYALPVYANVDTYGTTLLRGETRVGATAPAGYRLAVDGAGYFGATLAVSGNVTSTGYFAGTGAYVNVPNGTSGTLLSVAMNNAPLLTFSATGHLYVAGNIELGGTFTPANIATGGTVQAGVLSAFKSGPTVGNLLVAQVGTVAQPHLQLTDSGLFSFRGTREDHYAFTRFRDRLHVGGAVNEGAIAAYALYVEGTTFLTNLTLGGSFSTGSASVTNGLSADTVTATSSFSAGFATLSVSNGVVQRRIILNGGAVYADLPGVIFSTAAPSGSASPGTLWISY